MMLSEQDMALLGDQAAIKYHINQQRANGKVYMSDVTMSTALSYASWVLGKESPFYQKSHFYLDRLNFWEIAILNFNRVF